MLSHRAWAVPVLLLVLATLGACTYWSRDFDRLVDQSDRDFSRDPERNHTDVELEKLIKAPSSYMLMNVRFTALLNRQDEKIFVTMYSTFRQEDYYSFSVWPVGARVWEEQDRLRSVPTLYIRKDNPDLQKVVGAERYAVVHCRGQIMGDYDSGEQSWGRLPFIEVHNLDLGIGGPEYDDETIKLMASGLEDAAQKRPAVAKDKLKKAIQGTLGPAGRALALARLGLLHEESGQFELAVDHYELALDVDPANAEAKEGLDRALKVLERKRQIQAPK